MLWSTNWEASAGSHMPGSSALLTRQKQRNVPASLIVDEGFESFFPLHAYAQRWNNYRKELSLLMFSCSDFLHGNTPRP
jgi:hypothetical protein